MKKKSVISLIASLALVAVIGVGSTMAYFTDSDEAKNVITTGRVEADLEEPKYDEESGGDKTIEDVMPNQVITKDPTIVVKAGSEACYLRAKIDIVGLEANEGYAQQLVGNINILNGWVLSTDGYYYYQTAVAKNETEDQRVLFFDKVTIPATWGNEIADKKIEINVSAEAIQADNIELTKDTSGTIIGWPN